MTVVEKDAHRGLWQRGKINAADLGQCLVIE
jgi:hypothetical protein